mmetsp:Transcript_20888/g.31377  ORF Transcript_20888/g.31377 Transcript_20888/m.31377 type:complete len:239 (-) Transcript_20888:223-939(-)
MDDRKSVVGGASAAASDASAKTSLASSSLSISTILVSKRLSKLTPARFFSATAVSKIFSTSSFMTSASASQGGITKNNFVGFISSFSSSPSSPSSSLVDAAVAAAAASVMLSSLVLKIPAKVFSCLDPCRPYSKSLSVIPLTIILPATLAAAAAPFPLDNEAVPDNVAPEDERIDTPSSLPSPLRVTPPPSSSSPKKDFVPGDDIIATMPLLSFEISARVLNTPLASMMHVDVVDAKV